mmetsp:Transcript_58638/g.156992  ORF Transcript_58638/g.156992 Transcript_58638/m.156992 type:complete len:266 (-) Transcript_58638:232-1029(-)
MMTQNGFMPMVIQEGVHGGFQQQDQSAMTTMLEGSKLVKSESMDITNDPRFFTDNVIDKRLAAFGGLSIVSGLMVQTAMDAAFDMRKDMNFATYEGIFQFFGFLLICAVLYFNMLATYVGVAQPYHTYRLMTAGPVGFEAAATYYLHRDVVAWRHLSIKLMLLSLPVYFASAGLRLLVKFDRDTAAGPDLPGSPPLYARAGGLACCAAFVLVGLGLVHVHWRHEEVFRGIHDTVCRGSGVGGVMAQVQQIMAPRGRGLFGNPLDV